MKVKSVKVLNDGMEETAAIEFWKQIEGFAQYSFNAAHSCAYTIISYISMYLKTYYPAEYYSGLLTIEKVEKRAAILKDMSEQGISLVMPDVNHSTDCFTPIDAKTVTCPFASVKGVSNVATKAIIAARENGPFKSKEDFLNRVVKKSCNSAVVDKLDRVGAFAGIEKSQPSANDKSRLRDQVELMEGLIIDAVPITRETRITEESANELVKAISDCRAHHFCGGDEEYSIPKPTIEGSLKFVIVVDSPSRDEESQDQMGYGKGAEFIIESLEKADASMQDVYLTSLYKIVKPKAGYSTAFKAEVTQFVDMEMQALKPKLIVALGQESAKHFVPDMPGKVTDNEGRVFYDAKNDWNVLIGMNPNRIIYDANKQEVLDGIIQKAVSLI